MVQQISALACKQGNLSLKDLSSNPQHPVKIRQCNYRCLWPQHCGMEILEALWPVILSKQQASDSERYPGSKTKAKSVVRIPSNSLFWSRDARAQVNECIAHTYTHMCTHTTHISYTQYIYMHRNTHIYKHIYTYIYTHTHTKQPQFRAFSHLLSD